MVETGASVMTPVKPSGAEAQLPKPAISFLLEGAPTAAVPTQPTEEIADTPEKSLKEQVVEVWGGKNGAIDLIMQAKEKGEFSIDDREAIAAALELKPDDPEREVKIEGEIEMRKQILGASDDIRAFRAAKKSKVLSPGVIEIGENGTSRTVRMHSTIKPFLTALDRMTKAKASTPGLEEEYAKRAQRAQGIIDTVQPTIKKDRFGFYFDVEEQPKQQTPEAQSAEEAGKLAEIVKQAQEVMFDEWGNIICSDDAIGNPLLTTILRFASKIDPANEHVGFVVNGALKMLRTRLARRLPPNDERVTTVNNLITVFKNIEGQPEAARSFAERLSGHVDLLKLTDEEMASLFNENTQLSDVMNIIAKAAKDRPEIPDQLEQALNSLVPEGTFDTKNIIEDLKKHEKYGDYIKTHSKEEFEGRAAEGNLFHEEKKRNLKDKLLIAAMFLMFGAQVLQGTDQEAMMGGSREGGGGQPG